MQNYRNQNTGALPIRQPIQNNRAPAKNPLQPPRNGLINGTPPNVRYERIRPMKPQPQSQHERSRQTAHQNAARPTRSGANRKSRTKLALRDYFFGLAVGLIIFGIAAIIVCNALIGMIS